MRGATPPASSVWSGSTCARSLPARCVLLLGPERYLSFSYPQAFQEIRGLRRLLRQARPRVVVAFLGSTSVTAILAARPLGLPVVISERNDPAIETLDDPWQYLRERCYRWGTVVTANSRGALETMTAFVPASKLAYVPNPVLVRQAGPGAASRNPVILAVGRLVPQKAFDILLRAFAGGAGGLAGWSVEILGDGPLRKELERLAEELGVRHRVVFHGYVDDPAAHYARAGIFALPSRYEGSAERAAGSHGGRSSGHRERCFTRAPGRGGRRSARHRGPGR